jgi:hypothetical protein
VQPAIFPWLVVAGPRRGRDLVALPPLCAAIAVAVLLGAVVSPIAYAYLRARLPSSVTQDDSQRPLVGLLTLHRAGSS